MKTEFLFDVSKVLGFGIEHTARLVGRRNERTYQ